MLLSSTLESQSSNEISIIGLSANTHYNIRSYDCAIRVLLGLLHINGYTMKPSDKHYNICSLKSHSALNAYVDDKLEITESCVKDRGIPFSEELEQFGAIIEVTRAGGDQGSNTTMLRNTYKALWEEPDNGAADKPDNFRYSKGRDIVISEECSCAVDAVLSRNHMARLAVCGPKDAGKSTLCRYAVNRLLSVHRKVLFLETDIGQCEFTPSGLISLTLLSEPLLSPPYNNKPTFTKFLNLKQEHLASESFCLGVVTPSQILDQYLDKIKILIEKGKRLNEEIPLVVNFMGWTKGFGVGLHADLLRMLDPTHVLNLSIHKRKDLPPIPELLSTPGIRPLTDNIPTPHICDIPGYTGTEAHKPAFAAYELRHMALLNYFAPVYDSSTSAITVPYKVSWRNIAVILPEDIIPALAAYTLNSSVVGLLVGSPVYNTSDEEIKLTTDSTTRQCVGYGIIRAVDVVQKLFYLNTPVPAPLLEQVVVFKHTALPVPHVKSGSLPLPYVSNLAACEIIGVGGRSQRGNLKRRYHAISQQ